VPFTIPGERVRIALADSANRRSAATFGVLVEVLRPSPHRITPDCPHFLPGRQADRGCGGCSWQHIAYPEQLRLKSALVERLLRATLRRVPAVSPTMPGTSVSNPWGYRHKVHFVFGNRGSSGRRRGALAMGHYARGSRRIVAVRECPVHDPRGNRAAFGLFDAFERAGVAAASPVEPGGDRGVTAGVLRSIAVRAGTATPELMATLVVANDRDKQLRAATRRGMEDPGAPTALHLNIHPRDDAYIFGRDTRRISGPERLRDEVAGTSFLISPTSFFQTNVYAAEILVRLVLDAVPGDALVLDLYAGAGLFALPLAKRGHRVTAIEENRAAIADGEASARLNRVAPGRCRFIAGRVEDALAAVRTADAAVLDPPREGCSPQVIGDLLGRLRPKRVVYISCNPEALARDLAEAAAFPYEIDAVQPVDMFPHTAHVETVVTLTRRR
jgi:23S rRNA (uracil1939-C5)-methyltransferase